jgi:hypothetical protein
VAVCSFVFFWWGHEFNVVSSLNFYCQFSRLDAIIPRHISTITKDKDIGVVSAVLDSIKQIAKQLGPAAIEPYMPAIGDGMKQ